MANTHNTLTELFTDTANAIRSKTGGTAPIKADDFPSVISGISVGVEGGIIPTGTKTITTNGTHDVTTYASAQVNVSTGITPTGTKTITTNGTHDVTNYASAVVNVPSNSVIRTVTVSADFDGEKTLITGDDYVKANYAKDNFCIIMVPQSSITNEQYVVPSIVHGNRLLTTSGTTKYYGYALVYTSATGMSAALNTAKISGQTWTAGFRASSSGNVVVYLNPGNRKMKAGTYQLLMSCIE